MKNERLKNIFPDYHKRDVKFAIKVMVSGLLVKVSILSYFK